jgi:hypothetical protein
VIGALLLALLAPADADPLAPAGEGKMLCHRIDRAERTCETLAGYARNADGSYRTTAIGLVSTDPLMTITMHSTVHVRDGAVCERYGASDVQGAVRFADGTPVPAAKARERRKWLARQFAAFDGREICSRYTANGDSLRVQVTIDGDPQPEDPCVIEWVRPEDGYRVLPKE